MWFQYFLDVFELLPKLSYLWNIPISFKVTAKLIHSLKKKGNSTACKENIYIVKKLGVFVCTLGPKAICGLKKQKENFLSVRFHIPRKMVLRISGETFFFVFRIFSAENTTCKLKMSVFLLSITPSTFFSFESNVNVFKTIFSSCQTKR